MRRTHTFKRILSTLLLLCMLLSSVKLTAFAATSSVRDGEVVKQGTLVTSEDGMVTVQETASHTSGNNFNVTMTVTISDLVEIEPVRPAHIVLCIDRSNSMDGQRRQNTKTAVDEFVSGVLSKDGIAAGNQIAVVSFGTRYWSHCSLTSEVSTVNSAVSAATTAVSDIYDGGTNVQAGLYAAQQVFASDNSTAQKVIVLFSDGIPTYSYRLTGTADWSGCTNSGRRHNWNQSNGTVSNLTTKFDHNTIVGSGSAYEYNQDSHYASLQVTCEHGKSTTLTNKIYTNNGEPAIAQAQMAKDAGIEIYTVFLDGYGNNDESSKKNAEDTMKRVATNNDHYMATQDMSELSSLFQSISSSLVTPTNAGVVTAPMGSYIQLGEISGLEGVGIAETASGLTWNVTAVTPTVAADTGLRTYSVTYPISLQVEKSGFVEAKSYAVNPFATLTYSVGGVEKQVSFDIPTVRGYLPSVEYSIFYYLQGTAEAGDYVNYTLQDTVTGLSGTLHSKVGYPAGYETRYPDHKFVYSSTGPELTLSSTGANVMCLYYDSTYLPPVDVNYTIRHEYYTNNVLDGFISSEQSAPEGSVLSSAALEKVYTYNGETYEFTGATPDMLTVSEVSTITLRYDRTVEIPPVQVAYTIRHEYYTNDKLDGNVIVEQTGDAGTTLTLDLLSKIPTYNERIYTFTSCTPSELTLTEGIENSITLRYDHTEVQVPYTVLHVYYTNGEKDGEIPALMSAPEGTEISASGLEKNPFFSDVEYTFTSYIPEVITLESGRQDTIVLRYDRTVELQPVEVGYTVIYEFYTNGEKDGDILSAQVGEEGTAIVGDDLLRLPTYNGEEYEYRDSVPKELTLTPDTPAVIRVRYHRAVETPVTTKYTVIHQYYTGNKLDGQIQETIDADIGAIIESAGLTKNTVFSNGTYVFKSANYEILVVSEDGENKLILRYTRSEDSEEPASKPTQPTRTEYDDPSSVDPDKFSPRTGDNSFVWLYIFSGAGLCLFLLFVIPALTRPKDGSSYKGSRKKK